MLRPRCDSDVTENNRVRLHLPDNRVRLHFDDNGVGGVSWSMQHLLIELCMEVFDDIGTDVGLVGAPER